VLRCGERERESKRQLESGDVNDSILWQLIYYYMKAREEKKRQESEVESTRNYSMRAISGTTNSWSFVLQVIKPFPIPASNACRLRCTAIPITSWVTASGLTESRT
jgi:hypothetical protein